MHPTVRDLYKRFIIVGRDYPLGLEYVRNQVKVGFRPYLSVKTDRELNAAVIRGRYYVREMIALIQLKKYRTLKARYQPDEPAIDPAALHLKPYDEVKALQQEQAENK